MTKKEFINKWRFLWSDIQDMESEIEKDLSSISVKKELKSTDDIIEVINYLNSSVNKNFSAKTKETIRLVGARLKQYSVDQAKQVIDIKSKQWLGDSKMSAYLCPSTLFAESNFEKYLNEAPKQKPVQLGFEVKSDNLFYDMFVIECKSAGLNWLSYKEWLIKNV